MNIPNLKNKAILFVLAALLGGCCGGGSTTTKVENLSTTKTVGEQLMDLQKAKDTGAITEKQYMKARQEILDKLEK